MLLIVVYHTFSCVVVDDLINGECVSLYWLCVDLLVVFSSCHNIGGGVLFIVGLCAICGICMLWCFLVGKSAVLGNI